jgi:hypothetical protein
MMPLASPGSPDLRFTTTDAIPGPRSDGFRASGTVLGGIFRHARAASLRGAAGCLTVDGMTAQPANGTEPFEVIHLGGEAAAIVPLADLRRLRALERHAPAEVLEDAEIEATVAGHDEWAQAGRPGARSHDDVMAELLAGR